MALRGIPNVLFTTPASLKCKFSTHNFPDAE